MRVIADRSRCCSSGNCVLAAPEVFDQEEEDGVVLVRVEQPPAALEQGVRRAAGDCPVGAISLE